MSAQGLPGEAAPVPDLAQGALFLECETTRKWAQWEFAVVSTAPTAAQIPLLGVRGSPGRQRWKLWLLERPERVRRLARRVVWCRLAMQSRILMSPTSGRWKLPEALG